MTFPRIRAPGMWALGSVIAPSEMEALDRDQSQALDGTGGGTYAPSTPLVIGGAGGHFTGPLIADIFEGHITAGRVLHVDGDGSIQVQGTSGHLAAVLIQPFGFIGVASGGNVIWANGSFGIVQSGGTFNVQSDASLQVDSGAGFTVGCQADVLSGGKWRALSGAKFQVLAGAAMENASVLGVQLTGTAPTKSADPGASNIAIGLNQSKAFGWLRSDGSGGVSIEDGMNITTTILGTEGWTVTMTRPMANSTYTVDATYQYFAGDDATNYYLPRVKILSNSVFEVRLLNVSASVSAASPVPANVATSKLGVSVIVKGRQT